MMPHTAQYLNTITLPNLITSDYDVAKLAF